MSPGRARRASAGARRSTRAGPCRPGSGGWWRDRRRVARRMTRMLPCDWCDGWDVARRVSGVPRPARPAAASSSSRACASAVADSSRPASIRDSSRSRPASSRATTPLRVTAPSLGLAHHQVLVGEGGDLRQVGDDQDLGGPGQRGQPPADLDRRLAADAGVDLVEDQRRHRVGARQHDLDREHDPRQLAAGRALLQRPRRAPRRAGAAASRRRRRRAGRRPRSGRRRRARRPSTSVCATPTSTAALAIASAGELGRRPGRRTGWAASVRAADSSPAVRASSATRSSRRGGQQADRGRRRRRGSVSRAAACCAQASTADAWSAAGSASSPYLRTSRDSSARRSCTTASRAGSVSTEAAYDATSAPTSASR